jgi:hypothetical protein
VADEGGADRLSPASGLLRRPAGVAQLVAQTTCNRQVVGSIPTAGSKFPCRALCLDVISR